MRRAVALLAAALLLMACAGCGASDAQQLSNVKQIVADTVLGFMTTQVSEPEVHSGTLEVQIALYPKDEQRARADGICQEIAREIADRHDASNYPDLIQIYGSNGDYWLQCEPSDYD